MSDNPPDLPGRPSGSRHEFSLPVSMNNNPGTAPRFLPQPPPERPDAGSPSRAEKIVAAVFVLSTLASMGFVVVYFLLSKNDEAYTPALGICFALALLGIGTAVILWSKSLMPNEEAVQERHTLPSDATSREKTARVFNEGTLQTGIERRSLLRRSAVLALGAFALPMLVPLLSLGKYQFKEHQLSITPWKKGTRLVDEENLPVRPGDLAIGGIKTVLPEGDLESGVGPTVLVRLGPGENQPVKGREDWAYDGQYVAYSMICTHAGCPVKLYERQTHHLLCPCHQSTFLVTEHCKPIFGPASRSLPQLPITVDAEGFFVAQNGYDQPVGPGYWERG